MIHNLCTDIFQQAIAQSGAELNDWALNPPASNPEDYTRQVADDLDCIRSDDYQMMGLFERCPMGNRFSIILVLVVRYVAN